MNITVCHIKSNRISILSGLLESWIAVCTPTVCVLISISAEYFTYEYEKHAFYCMMFMVLKWILRQICVHVLSVIFHFHTLPHHIASSIECFELCSRICWESLSQQIHIRIYGCCWEVCVREWNGARKRVSQQSQNPRRMMKSLNTWPFLITSYTVLWSGAMQIIKHLMM